MKVLTGVMILVAAVAMAQDKVKVQPAFKTGDTYKHKATLTVKMDEMEVTVKGIFESKVTTASPTVLDTSTDFKEVMLNMGDGERELSMQPMVVNAKPDGTILNVTGGFEDADPVRAYFLTYFPWPPKEMAPGEAWTSEVAKNDKGIPHMKVDATYVGAEDVSGKKSHKFKVKLMEQDGEKFSTDGTIWVTAEGKILKIDNKFENLPIRVAGFSAGGTFKAELVD